MTNISKDKVKTEDYKVLQQQLHILISKLNTDTAKYLFDDLLTETEQIMLTKRFAAIFMFNNYYSPYRVSQTLAISTSTANRLFEQFESGKFNNLLNCLKKKEFNQFLSLIEDLIMAQVSPRARARLMNRVP